MSNTYKYKAESLAFLRKEIQDTKNAMDKALTTARSFSTRECRQLSKGLSTAIEAEAARNKEVLKVEATRPRGKMATNTANTPTCGVVEEEAAEEGEAEGMTPTDIEGTPHQKPFSNPHIQRWGSHFFQSRMDL